jgi:hypothetical protein
MTRTLAGTACMAALLSLSAPAWGQDLSAELAALKTQMAALQAKIERLEQAPSPPPVAPVSAANAFNPAISAVLNGRFAAFSNTVPTVAGFSAGEEGGRMTQGLSLGESEIGIQANVDDQFTARVTAALGDEGVELEEAYIRTTGLPGGLGVTAGRFLAPMGYLNEHHAHTDDFADRPLPSRIFLDGAYKDDGLLASWILPTDLYAEIGGAALRGGRDRSRPGAWLAYAKTGGDIGDRQSWLLGFSALRSKPEARAGNEDTVDFSGESNLAVASLRYVWEPTGNRQEQEVTLQAEYFHRNENGTYEDTAAATGAVPYDGGQSGWYAQGVYAFMPRWRVGARYSVLDSGDIPAGLAGSALDAAGHDPWNAALMADWTNSEFSRIRLQYGYEEPSAGRRDNQFMLQYIMAIGAHPAHMF